MAGRKQTATMELAIGATIIAGVIVLIVMLMAWGNSTSFLSSHYRIVVNMANVGGLKEGAPVKLGGFQIGRVASIQIRSGATDMEIILDIDEQRLLPKGSSAKVSTAGLVGDAFMEIIPGKSAEPIKRAKTVAEAERIDSSPLPDLSELLIKVNVFGEQLSILTANLNDIVGDTQFRRNIKSLAVNIDSVSHQANLILQRSQGVIDNVELATKNIAEITENLNERIDEVTGDIRAVSGKMVDIADKAEEAANRFNILTDKAIAAIDNIDGGISDARTAIKNTVGDPDFAASLSGAMKNVNTVTEGLAHRRGDIDKLLGNLGTLSDDLRKITGRVGQITDKIEPQLVSDTLASLTGAIGSMTEVVDKIKAEPVLALSINKAADRIVKIKFDEMSKSGHYRTSDEILREINRWVQENMKRGHFQDPSYSYEQRPYTFK